MLRSPDDRVLLRVPAGAVPGRTRFSYQPQADVPNPPAGLRFGFRVKAQDESGQAVDAVCAGAGFALGLSADAALQAHERLSCPPYNETTQQWVAVAGAAAAAATAGAGGLTHLTLFAVTAASSFVPEVMPSIRGVQSDLFTGSASITYPIALPPGRGGLTPELALQFNSRSRHDDPGNSSVLGTGWKLSADSFIGELWEYGVLQTYIWRIAGVAYTEAGNGSTGGISKKRRSGASSSPVTPGTPMRRTARAIISSRRSTGGT